MFRQMNYILDGFVVPALSCVAVGCSVIVFVILRSTMCLPDPEPNYSTFFFNGVFAFVFCVGKTNKVAHASFRRCIRKALVGYQWKSPGTARVGREIFCIVRTQHFTAENISIFIVQLTWYAELLMLTPLWKTLFSLFLYSDSMKCRQCYYLCFKMHQPKLGLHRI